MERVSGVFGATTTGVVEKLTSRVIGKDPLSIFHLREKHTKSILMKTPCGKNVFKETTHTKSHFLKTLQNESHCVR